MSSPSSSEFAAGKYVKPNHQLSVDGGARSRFPRPPRVSDGVEIFVRFLNNGGEEILHRQWDTRTSRFETHTSTQKEAWDGSGVFIHPVSAIHSLNVC
jgi:hypothetical protein